MPSTGIANKRGSAALDIFHVIFKKIGWDK
jgi:hypothetical protein